MTSPTTSSPPPYSFAITLTAVEGTPTPGQQLTSGVTQENPATCKTKKVVNEFVERQPEPPDHNDRYYNRLRRCCISIIGNDRSDRVCRLVFLSLLGAMVIVGVGLGLLGYYCAKSGSCECPSSE